MPEHHRGLEKVGETDIHTPKPANKKKKGSSYQRRKAKQRFRRSAVIEPVIGHLKHDHRMIKFYPKGAIGDRHQPVYDGNCIQLQKVDAEAGRTFCASGVLSLRRGLKPTVGELLRMGWEMVFSEATTYVLSVGYVCHSCHRCHV